MEETETWTGDDERNTTLAQIDRAILKLQQDQVILDMERCELLQLNPVQATPHWRKVNGERRYLILLYPTDAEGNRRRPYVGSKPDKVAAALAQVQAHEDLQQVTRQIDDITARLTAVDRLLQRALHLATSST